MGFKGVEKILILFTFCQENSSGFEIKFDLGVTLNDFQTSVLPTGDIDMYMQNRSQYHRLSSFGDTEEFDKVSFYLLII